MSSACRSARAIRRAAVERFRVHPDRVVATPLAPRSDFRAVKSAPAVRPYLLFVGTLEPRKNVPAMLAAWREVRKVHDVDLVLAGRRRPDGPDISSEPGLRLLGEVPDEQLPGLYSGALAFVYPSCTRDSGCRSSKP